ncbi:MAG: NADH-quinone oxidoreductase subunit J [Pirellulaceae bacterium]|nr:NADH-quinone oxidoreductase subunit J [Pirellulaceae bacterium]
MELWLTYGFCAVAVVLAIAFALIKHPVHAALSFACVVLASAGVYLLQDAAFIAASTVVVYAGATIIIFMFVLMFAQQTNLLDYDTHKQNPIAAGIVAIALAATVIAVALKEFPKLEKQLAAKNGEILVAADESAVTETAANEAAATASSDQAKPAEGEAKPESAADVKDADEKTESMALKSSGAVDEKAEETSAETENAIVDRFTVAKLGAAFYTRYLLAIEIAGTLLLVATIGAVVIAQREPAAQEKQTDAKGTTKS